ncbi:hypothetical protein [Halosimplex halobium]|uniref:hypothetical protein n=1 Tax=Halosimplex halobium TaxID=3396618 RepID=UPI003F555865
MDHARHALIVVCLGLLAATAGCGFLAGGGAESATPPTASGANGTTTAESTATPTDAEPSAATTPAASDGHVVTVAGNRTINATLVFERVERLHGVDADRPTVSVVDGGEGAPTRRVYTAPFFRALGLTGNVTLGGVASGGTDVVLNADNPSPEAVLVHEFAHIVHQQQRWRPTGLSSVTYDEWVAARSVGEGAATYVGDVYAARYDGDVISGTRYIRLGYEAGNAPYRLNSAPYLAGAGYVHSRAGSPSELGSILRDPPETTEGILHPDRNVSVGNLTVATADGNWSAVPGHYSSDSDRRGELLVRELLRLELDRPVADSAANGWDNDRSLSLVAPDGNGTGVAWTLRWENATEADEFAAAFDRFADRRAANSSLRFSSDRVAPETVTVFAGNETFVEGAAATGTNESVRVVAPGANATVSAEGPRRLAAG